MLKNINCDLCGSEDADIIFDSTINFHNEAGSDYSCASEGHGEHYRIIRCRNCGLYYCSPRPQVEQFEFYYERIEDAVYQEEERGRRRTFQRNLKNLSEYKKSGRLLEVGSYLGIFLDEARKNGWDAEGIEPSQWCVEKARGMFGLNIRQGTYKDIATSRKKFEVLAMWDVLEHLDSPMNALRIAREALEDDGILVFSTVDIGSFYARFLGAKWPWLMKMHLYYFDRRSIVKYLERSGFRPIKIRTYRHTVSLKYLLHKLKRINRFLFFAMNSVYFICRLLKKEVFLTVALGDFMEVYAQKSLSGAARE